MRRHDVLQVLTIVNRYEQAHAPLTTEKLGSLIGVSRMTAYTYIGMLQDLGWIYQLNPKRGWFKRWGVVRIG